MKKGVFGFAALVVSWVWAFPSAVTYVDEGATVSLEASTKSTSAVTDTGSNKYGSFVYAQGDSTLKVTVPSGAKQAVMWSALFVTNGVLTLDLTDVAAAGIPYYQHGGIITRYPDANGTMCEGAVVVKGVDNLLCGDPQNSYERFEITQMSFVDAAGAPVATGAVTFTNHFNLMSVPSCAWSVAEGGLKTFGLGQPRVLDSLVQDGVFALPNCSTFTLLDNDMVDPAATIRVGAYQTLSTYYTHYADASSFKTTPNTTKTGSEGFFWSMNGYGSTEQVVDNAIELARNATLRVGLRVTTFNGPVSGAGVVTVVGSGDNSYCRATFRKPVAVSTFTAQPGNPKATFNLAFEDSFAGELALASTNVVATFTGTRSEVARITGVDAELPAADVLKYPAVKAGAGAYVKIEELGGRVRFVTEEDGQIEYRGVVYASKNATGALLVDGEWASLPADFKFIVPAGEQAAIPSLGDTVVKVDGTATFAARPWKSPVLWLDASDAGSVSNVLLDAAVTGNIKDGGKVGGYETAENYAGELPFVPTTTATNGLPYTLLERWNDCRASQTGFYAFQTRHRSVDYGWWPQVYPIVVPDGLNGRTYISMDGLGGTGKYRRLEMSRSGTASLRPQFACMVFGSQGGGGNALLASPALGRGYPSDTAWSKIALSAPVLTNEAFKTDHVWIDGEAVDPTTEGLLNGGWQIVSIRLDGEPVNGLGYWKTSSKDSGGQNYAEVLFFDEVPTDAQRVEIETYLARKWGLAEGYKGDATARALNVYGAGEIEVDGATLAAAGAFAGTVTLRNGAEYVIPDTLRPIPSADDVADIAGRTSWFDPDQEGAVKYWTSSTYATCVNVLYDRVLGTADGAYALASAQGRAPSVETRTAGFGVSRKWLQYANVNPTETGKHGGNALRVNTMPSAYANDVTPIAGTRTVVMVMDSSQGGGSPFLDVGINGSKINRFTSNKATLFSKDWTKPIWNSTAATTYFNASAGGATYLNGAPVDGATTGFTGGPEVLTAVSGSAFGLGATGGYSYKDFANAPDDTDPHVDVGELQGEMLTFSTALADADRQMVESYLMYKWFGYLPCGTPYGTAAGVTVAGDGRVTAPSYERLPRFAPDFAGTAEIAAPLDLAVAVDADGTATPAVALPKVVLAGSQKLKVTFPGRTPKGGDWYTVVSAAGGLADVAWVFDLPDGVVAEVTDTAVRIKPAAGFLLIFK